MKWCQRDLKWLQKLPKRQKCDQEGQAVKMVVPKEEERSEKEQPHPIVVMMLDRPIKDRGKELLAAFDKCEKCTRCNWTKAGSKGCKECLGSFQYEFRLTKYVQEFMRSCPGVCGAVQANRGA